MTLVRTATSSVLFFAALGIAACGSDSVSGPAASEAAPSGGVSIARHVVARNAAADAQYHLVARQYLNDETEVAELYEPKPGVIVFSAAGSPKQASVVKPELFDGKSAEEIWAIVAPGVPVPEPLAQAIARSKNPELRGAAADDGESRASAGTEGAASEAPETGRATPELMPMNTGYCATRFWSDFGNWGASPWVGPWGSGSHWRYAANLNVGGVYNYVNNVTQGGWAACPTGDKSGKGGRLYMWTDDPKTGGWDVEPNYYRANIITSTPVDNCGFDFRCVDVGDSNRCSPNLFSNGMHFESYCYIDNGATCGDDFGWITYYQSHGDYCQPLSGNSNPCAANPGSAGCGCLGNTTCTSGNVCLGSTCYPCGQTGNPCCAGGACPYGGSCQPWGDSTSCF